MDYCDRFLSDQTGEYIRDTTFDSTWSPMEKDVLVNTLPNGRYNPTDGEILQSLSQDFLHKDIHPSLSRIQISRLKGEY